MSGGLLNQRSERDIAEACSVTFHAVVISANRHLPAHVLADRAVQDLLGVWNTQAHEEQEKADRIQKQMEARAREAMANFEQIGKDLHAHG